jgi:hypothetical protein
MVRLEAKGHSLKHPQPVEITNERPLGTASREKNLITRMEKLQCWSQNTKGRLQEDLAFALLAIERTQVSRLNPYD